MINEEKFVYLLRNYKREFKEIETKKEKEKNIKDEKIEQDSYLDENRKFLEEFLKNLENKKEKK